MKIKGRAHPWLASAVGQNALAEVVIAAIHDAVVTATNSLFMGVGIYRVSRRKATKPVRT